MKSLSLPIFGNTCGKLYEDYILLASENNEQTLPLNSVKKITFTKRIAISSLLFILLPCVFFILPFYMQSEDTFIKVLLYVLGVLFVAVSIQKAERKNALKIFTTNGFVLSISVINNNTAEAEKFVKEATKLLIINKAVAKAKLSEQRTAENIFTNVTIAGGAQI